MLRGCCYGRCEFKSVHPGDGVGRGEGPQERHRARGWQIVVYVVTTVYVGSHPSVTIAFSQMV